MLSSFVRAYYGLIYIHQSMIGVMVALIYLAICIILDDEIMLLCSEMGFRIKPSRKYKFYLLFACIGAFVLASMICSGMTDTWVTNPDWLRNSSDDLRSPQCQWFLAGENHDVRFLGKIETFDLSSNLFYLVGMGFGTSYSMTQTVDILDWIKTPLYLKAIRMILGSGIIFGIYFFFKIDFQMESQLEMSQFFFYSAVPKLLISSIIYGPFVILCKKCGLV